MTSDWSQLQVDAEALHGCQMAQNPSHSNLGIWGSNQQPPATGIVLAKGHTDRRSSTEKAHTVNQVEPILMEQTTWLHLAAPVAGMRTNHSCQAHASHPIL